MKVFHKVLLSFMSLCCLASPTVKAETITALVDFDVLGQGLYTFDTAQPLFGAASVITGTGAGELLTSIDFRPSTAQLYGLSSGSSIYTINPIGFSTRVGSGFTNSLSGTQFGFDFNPVIDRIRIVSDLDQNMVAHPDTGDANIAATTAVFYGVGDVNAGANPNVVHHAYTNNVLFGTAASTQLYAIDTNLDILVTQANNAGTLGTVGSLGIDATDVGGFDIASNGIAYAAFGNGVTSDLYSIDLATGTATNIGFIPFNVRGLTVTAVPEPSTVLLGAAFVGIGYARRRLKSMKR